MLKVSKNNKWKIYWGEMPLPAKAEAFGTVQRETLETGALIRLSTGIYIQGNAGAIRSLPQREVEEAVAFSEAAGALGSMSSEKKARAARENGKLGGRPRKNPMSYNNQQETQHMHTNLQPMTTQQKAINRVRADAGLDYHYKTLIEYEWDNMDEHLEWVTTAPRNEILEWLAPILEAEETQE